MPLRFPPIFLLPTHLHPEELHQLEDTIPSITYDIHEAELVLGKLARRERAMFELRRAKLNTEPEPTSGEAPSRKRQRLDDTDDLPGSLIPSTSTPMNTVKVLRLAWFIDSVEQDRVLPIDDYLLYEGRKLPRKPESQPSKELKSSPKPSSSIIQRAAGNTTSQPTFASARESPSPRSRGIPHAPSLLHQTTSEHDLPLAPIPDFLTTTYSCQRPTPVYSPNASFIEELKKIRTLRTLQGDQIGVRAYSTSIATLAAYPHQLMGAPDVARLPGCGLKIAELYQSWMDEGQLRETAEAASDERMTVLQMFYDIWGVGDITAREFYKKGWRDLDDIVEYGWETLSRVQQIGVKYYDEFKLKIPRKEVAEIGNIVLKCARDIDSGFQSVIVGGYRRGKKDSGDVDIVLSHPEETMTLHFIEKLVISLEKGRLITHTLSLSTKNSERGQMPVAWKGEGGKGSGFDTLDKALVVWQDPTTPGAPHRRVDLIVSPWKTVGCAVFGWSGGTTFQRDLRRYCKKERGLKFDSSGIRSRTDGTWVDIEGSAISPAPSMEAAEKRVFEALGLPWRAPEERCTG